MIGLRNALINPMIRATAIRVSSFLVVDPAVRWMPGSTAVATASAAAEMARRSRKRMGQSWHPPVPLTPSASPGATWAEAARTGPASSPPEMDEQPAEVLGVLLYAVVE